MGLCVCACVCVCVCVCVFWVVVCALVKILLFNKILNLGELDVEEILIMAEYAYRHWHLTHRKKKTKTTPTTGDDKE